ncbi:MAG: hypothetical protein H7174_10825, partial [Flavobacterium sp.]|nr:hypothetical protein [Flavobacterium sp.]
MFIFLFFINVNSQTQENKNYNAIDAFIANPKPENLQNLDKIIIDFNANKSIKTKDELLSIVILNCNKAFYENQFGQIKKAVSSYESAWRIFSENKLNNYDIIEFCLKPLGNLYIKIGDYDNAENTIKQYYHLAFISKQIAVTHAAILNLSIVYQQSGRIDAS